MPTYGEKEHLINKAEAFEHATLGVLQSGRGKLPGIDAWQAGAVAKAPTIIYDINGTPLFYDYAVKAGRTQLGTVRTAASKILGAPDVAYEFGARSIDFKGLVAKLLPKVKKAHRGKTIGAPRLVCYCYPKLGVLFPLTGPGRERSQAIYHFSGNEVPIRDPSTPIEGEFAYSFYDSLKTATRKKNLGVYAVVDDYRAKLTPALRKSLTTVKSIDLLHRRIEPWRLTSEIVRELAYCPHYATTDARGHHCFSVHGQQKWDYCAVATAQMLLDFFRYHETQDDIAPALGYSAGSGCPSDQSGGYATLSNNHLKATFDNSATWAKAKAHLQTGNPLKSGIPGHARACAGYAYRRSILIPIGGSSITDRRLLIYDPSPWNSDYAVGGSVYWENWDAVNHTNFIYVSIDK
ncbi:MAG: hypothetical protein KC486_06440 [Myxococcales bacterium]|nr:hypothetical protein [Myxococcales bacterium]